MAKYLWIGSAGTGGTYAADKYCFNVAGNWYGVTAMNGTQVWQATTATPGWTDKVIFGSEYRQGSPLPDLPGWTAAKSPCLFGGFSGGSSGGNWTSSGATLVSGTTFTTALSSITAYVGVSGYNFPYLGGGITGNIATWVIAREGLTGFNSLQSSQFRPVDSTLRVKTNSLFVENRRQFQSSVANGISGEANHTHLTKFIADFDIVRNFTPLGGGTGSGGTGSNTAIGAAFIKLDVGFGAGVRIRNGLSTKLDINIAGSSPESTIPYTNIKDYGIEIYNHVGNTIYARKDQAIYIKGCTFAKAIFDPFLWSKSPTIAQSYDSGPAIEFASNINAVSAFTDLFGITNSADIPDYASYNTLYAQPYSTGNVPLASMRATTGTGGVWHSVIIGDRYSETTICSVPKIRLDSAATTNGGTGNYLFIPWAAEFAGNVLTEEIKNNASFVYSNQDISPIVGVRVGQMTLANYGEIDFSKQNPEFDDWRFGGISGGQIVGGIVFDDETAVISGSQGLRLWNTQSKAGNIYNARLTSAGKVSPSTSPTLGTE